MKHSRGQTPDLFKNRGHNLLFNLDTTMNVWIWRTYQTSKITRYNLLGVSEAQDFPMVWESFLCLMPNIYIEISPHRSITCNNKNLMWNPWLFQDKCSDVNGHLNSIMTHRDHCSNSTTSTASISTHPKPTARMCETSREGRNTLRNSAENMPPFFIMLVFLMLRAEDRFGCFR